MHFEYDRLELSWIDFGVKIAFFVCSMQMFGAFFDQKWFAPYLEIFRCTGVIFYYINKICFDGIGLLPNRVFMLTVFGISAVLWIGYLAEQAVVKHIRLQHLAIFPATIELSSSTTIDPKHDNKNKKHQ
uniref:Uncharacterized protein n=1 Tax=Panagrolaimus sp. PS1159 TaxID=55785 RepID=A0AC35GN20_9BILA